MDQSHMSFSVSNCRKKTRLARLSLTSLADKPKLLLQPKPPKSEDQLVKLRPRSVRIQKLKMAKQVQMAVEISAVEKAVDPPIVSSLPLYQLLTLGQNYLEKMEYLDQTSHRLKKEIEEDEAAKPVAKVDKNGNILDSLGMPETIDILAVAQLAKGHIQTCDAMPVSQEFVIATGDSLGEVALWLGHDKSLIMRPHSKQVLFLPASQVVPRSLEMTLLFFFSTYRVFQNS